MVFMNPPRLAVEGQTALAHPPAKAQRGASRRNDAAKASPTMSAKVSARLENGKSCGEFRAIPRRAASLALLKIDAELRSELG
jgi:hypothetical protein